MASLANINSNEVIVEKTRPVTPSGNAVPDNALGVNFSGDIVTAINHRIQIFNAYGISILDVEDSVFFAQLAPDQLVFDPRIVHVPSVNRFAAIALHGTNPEHSKILVAISSSPDPMDPWHYYSFTGNACAADNNDVWLDYPDLSFTATELFVTANVFTNEDVFLGAGIWQLNLLAGMQGEDMNMTLWCQPTVDGEAGKSLVPAPALLDTGADDLWFVSTHIHNPEYPTTDTFHCWRITGPQDENPTLESFALEIPGLVLKWGQPVAQPGGELLLVNDLRVRSAFSHNGDITFALAAAKSFSAPWCTIRVYRINTSTEYVETAAPLWQVGSGYSYPKVLPWVEDPADWDGRCLVSFLKASSTDFPEVRAALLSEGLVWSPSMLIEPGTSNIGNITNYNRWGDYIDAQIRPNQGVKEIWLHAHVGEGGLYGNRVFKLVSDVLGCMDPSGCNYNSEATLDDGSCTYSPCIGCMLEGACNYNPNADVSGLCLFSGCDNPLASNFSPIASCNDGSCCFSNFLLLHMTDSYGDGWNGATYTITNASGEVIAEGTMSDGSESTASIGCSIGDCWTIQVTGGDYPNEIGWEIEQSTSPVFNWNGSTNQSIASGGANTTALFLVGDGGDASGCTDPEACNFSSNALCDDGSCCYTNCLAVHMTSTHQNGWHESIMWNIRNATSGTLAASGRMDAYGTQIDSLCLPDGCYELFYTPSSISWTATLDLVFGTDTLVPSGPASTEVSFSLGDIMPMENGGAWGCTDPSACNFQEGATCDDGSCCYEGCAVLHLLSPPEATTHFSFDDGTTWSPTGSEDTTLCFASGCHVLNTEGPQGGIWWLESTLGHYSGAVGAGPVVFAAGGSFSGCTDPLACNYVAEADCDDASCVFPECDDPTACNFVPNANCYASFVCAYSCLGCTYQSAANYQPEATTDDGSCVFPTLETPDCLGDLDSDGIIGVNDLLIILGIYGDSCG